MVVCVGHLSNLLKAPEMVLWSDFILGLGLGLGLATNCQFVLPTGSRTDATFRVGVGFRDDPTNGQYVGPMEGLTDAMLSFVFICGPAMNLLLVQGVTYYCISAR